MLVNVAANESFILYISKSTTFFFEKRCKNRILNSYGFTEQNKSKQYTLRIFFKTSNIVFVPFAFLFWIYYILIQCLTQRHRFNFSEATLCRL